MKNLLKKGMIGYKYRSFDNRMNIDALADNYIWASDVMSLNDPHECSSEFLIEKELKTIKQLFSLSVETEESIISALHSLNSQVAKIGIYSMSKDPLSPIMWASYAASETGFCIGYDIEFLQKYHSAPLGVHECMVEYQDTKPLISMFDIQQPNFLSKLYATKSKDWQYEKEIRLIYDGIGKKSYPWQSVKEVFFGLKSSEENKNKVIDLLKNYDVRFYQVCRSSLYGKLDAHLICEHKRPFEYSKDEYEILYTNHYPAVENFHLLIKKTNPTIEYLQDFAVKFRERYATISANINLYSEKIDINLFEKYPLTEKEKEYLNTVTLGSLLFDCTQISKWDL